MGKSYLQVVREENQKHYRLGYKHGIIIASVVCLVLVFILIVAFLYWQASRV